MKLRYFHLFAALTVVLGGMQSILSAPPAAAQQSYRNIVNARFRSVSSGPQSALIVDVANPNDQEAVRRAAMRLLDVRLRAERSAIRQQTDLLRRLGRIRPDQSFDYTTAAIVRHRGRLALPGPQRTRAGNELTFTIPTTGTGAWNAADAAEIGQLVNLIYPHLRDVVLGNPGWNGNVTILNQDPRLGKVDEPLGALLLVNGSTVEILFPSFSSAETKFLAMVQVMAQAFHGPVRIAYDAWEIGMGRAAAVVAARNLQAQVTVDPANGFYYTPNYDLLNQPPLGNNTFTPPTKSNQDFNPTTLSGMLIPRMQMSSTAWLKCYIENPLFFKNFNAAYYAAQAADPTVANDVLRLRSLAAGVVPQVEGLPFGEWYERQYVLDTSVTPGRKLYVYAFPTFPTTGSSGDSGAAAFVVYYDTTTGGDEVDRDGTGNVIYWDYSYQNRLTLPSFETVEVRNGFGTVSPFFTNIGGTPPDQMRVAMDFPVNREYVRINMPAGVTGTPTNPNNFSGVVVGADAGALSVTFDGGGTINTNVVQGVFGAVGTAGSVPTGFSKTQIIFTPTGGQPITYRRNLFQRPENTGPNPAAVSPVYVLYAPGQAETLSHTFPRGPAMISLPIKPFSHDLSRVFGTPVNTTLLAQYRQDLPGDFKYSLYPSLPLYQPGYGLWSNFATAINATSIAGQRTDVDPFLSLPLQFGWNQIGSPYNAALNILQDIVVQYLGGDILTFSEAVQRGWIATGVITFSQTSGFQDIMTTTDTTIPRNILEPWKGYYVRILVTEGVTFTFNNPNGRAAKRPTRAANGPLRENGGWRLPLSLRDSVGNETSALLGQSPSGSDTFTPALDIASPPAFTRVPSLTIRFPNKTGENGDGLLADVRRSATRAQWDVLVSVPEPQQTYTLAWNGTATLPKGTRLTLVDPMTGARQLMHRATSYTFQTGKDERTRRFQILVEPRALGRLRITNVAGTLPPPVAGRSARTLTLQYELSSPPETQGVVMQGGRVVRRPAPGRAAETGGNQVVWDTRDDQGRTLASGPYTVQITATTPEGEQTRSITPILLTR